HMLTGDENIVDAQIIVQYRIKDPVQYLFRLRDPVTTLRAATEVALRSRVGNTTVDEVLTVGRAKVQDETHTLLQQLMDTYESGLLVTAVKLQTVDAPEQVKDAFNEVVRAREDREKLVRQAEGYREDLIPKARGQAQEIIRAAEAYKEERILKSRGDAARFSSVLTEYRKAPGVTRERLHLETLERVLPEVEKIVLSGDGAGVVPILPLKEISIKNQAATGPARGN
ncbi:MAG TPA: FtsH protease activity modulator HflK, partial [Candidatus Binatia bacterium]